MIAVCRSLRLLHREIAGHFKCFFRRTHPFVHRTDLLLSLKAVAERLTLAAAGGELCLSVCLSGRDVEVFACPYHIIPCGLEVLKSFTYFSVVS